MMKKKNRRISAVISMVMALTIFASGCQKINEDGGIPSLNEVTLTSAEPTDTTAETEETTVPTETTAESETETETETTPQETTVVTTAPNEQEETTTAAETWTETAKAASMYVTQTCYSRERAIIGATPISQHYKGDKVDVVAITDTGYYKLADGGFIHSDYLSDKKPAETKPAETTAPSGGNSGGNSGGSSGGNIGGGQVDSGNYRIDPTSRYVYKQLNAKEQQLYLDIVNAAYNFETSVEFPEGMLSNDVFRVYALVFNCEPQLFWLGGSVSVGATKVSISYINTDEADIRAKQKELEKSASSVLSKVNSYSGTVSKLKVMFDYLVLNNEFASNSDYNSTVYNGITGRGGVQCAGYAKSMQYLCDLAGIECTTVLGITAEEVSHAWNVVYCENGYYNIDATWGDPLNEFGPNYVQYEFFLVPDAWIHNITHYHVGQIRRSNGLIVDLVPPPSCTKAACNYFAAYNKLYDNKADAEKAMYAAIDEAIKNGTNVAQVRTSSKADYDTLMSDDYFKAFQKYAKSKSGSVKKLLRRGSNSKGVQVVHYDIVYN